jgi:hypothetical protein
VCPGPTVSTIVLMPFRTCIQPPLRKPLATIAAIVPRL